MKRTIMKPFHTFSVTICRLCGLKRQFRVGRLLTLADRLNKSREFPLLSFHWRNEEETSPRGSLCNFMCCQPLKDIFYFAYQKSVIVPLLGKVTRRPPEFSASSSQSTINNFQLIWFSPASFPIPDEIALIFVEHS